MKTLIIYNSIEDSIKYFIVDGNFSHYNNVCINSTTPHPYKFECIEWLYNPQTGKENFEMSEDVSLDENK